MKGINANNAQPEGPARAAGCRIFLLFAIQSSEAFDEMFQAVRFSECVTKGSSKVTVQCMSLAFRFFFSFPSP